MHTLKDRKIGNALVVTLPKEVLQKLRDKTDSVIQINTSNSNFEKLMLAYREVSTKYKNALHELAK